MTSKEFIFQNELDQGLPTKEYSNFEGRVVSRLGGYSDPDWVQSKIMAACGQWDLDHLIEIGRFKL
jgi:hypothetical protein